MARQQGKWDTASGVGYLMMFSHRPPDLDDDKKQPVISRGVFLRE